jgi:hypothetical protein
MRTIWNSDGTDEPVLICPPPTASEVRSGKASPAVDFINSL